MLATIAIDSVYIGDRIRTISDEQVAVLMKSVGSVGLLNPITVYPRKIVCHGVAQDGYGLVAGAHRLEACSRLGLTEIAAQVLDLGDLERQIAECDENLCATKLTPSEKAEFTRRRKQAYLALHPETGHGAVGRGGKKEDNLSSFSDDQADKTGVDARTVRRDAERGEKVTPAAMAMVKGTKLDTGAYLDKLKKVAPEKQIAKVERDLAEKAKPKPKPAHKPSDASGADNAGISVAPDAAGGPAPSQEPEPNRSQTGAEPEPAPDPHRKGLSQLTRDGLEDECAGLRSENAELRERVAKQRGDIADLKARIKELSADNKGATIAGLQKRLEAANYRRDEALRVAKREEYKRKQAEKHAAEVEQIEVPYG